MNIFSKVKAGWNEVFTHEVREKQIWQKVCIGLGILSSLLTIGLIQVSLNSKVVLYVVEVDALGRANAIGEVQETKKIDDRYVRAYLYDFVEKSCSIITDPEAMRGNLTQVYKVVTPEVKNFLNIFYQQNNPMEKARSISRQIIPISFLKQSEKTFIVEWKQIDRDATNKTVDEARFKGLFMITQKAVTSVDQLKDNPQNPFGIYITNISWNRTM